MAIAGKRKPSQKKAPRIIERAGTTSDEKSASPGFLCSRQGLEDLEAGEAKSIWKKGDAFMGRVFPWGLGGKQIIFLYVVLYSGETSSSKWGIREEGRDNYLKGLDINMGFY